MANAQDPNTEEKHCACVLYSSRTTPNWFTDGLDLLGALLPNHVMRGAAIGTCMNFLDKEAGTPNRQGLMPAAGQNRLFEERYHPKQTSPLVLRVCPLDWFSRPREDGELLMGCRGAHLGILMS